jgi:hypothetical protein
MTYKTTLMATKAAKHFVETGKSSGRRHHSRRSGVLAAKKDGKRKRVAPGSEGRSVQRQIHHAGCTTKGEGYQMDSSQEERDFIERGDQFRKIMAMIADLVHKRSVVHQLKI